MQGGEQRDRLPIRSPQTSMAATVEPLTLAESRFCARNPCAIAPAKRTPCDHDWQNLSKARTSALARGVHNPSQLGRAPLGRGEVTMRYLTAWMFGMALAIASLVGCSEADGNGVSGCSLRGVTCDCVPTTNLQSADCNRVHLDNINFQPGIGVVLTSPGQACTIDQLLVDDPGDPGFELDQCVMNLAVGETLTIDATWLGEEANAPCVVDATANVPGIERELQTFADVFTEAVPLQLSVLCGGGFVQ